MRHPIIKSAILLFFIVASASAQENLLYKKVQEKKTADISFKTISSMFSQEQEDKNSLDLFINPDEVFFLQYNPSVMNTLSEAITLLIPLKNKELQLELFEVPASFYNYEVVTNDGQRYPANRKIKHYRGVVKNDPNSIVAITFCESELMGLVATEEGNFNLSLDKRLNKYLFYNDKNLKQKPDFECSTTDNHPTKYNPEILLKKSKLDIRSDSKCVYFYFETEFDIFQTKGSISSVESFVTSVYNQVATLYENENIETGISEIFVWDTTDPFTSNTTTGLLTQFQNQRTNFNGDLGQLLTFRSIGGGLAAGFNGICNLSVAQKLSVAMLYNNYLTVPNYSWSVFVVTHEFGHLFGSRHTHACVWNGNNTAIDGCGSCQESPDPEEETCNNCLRPAIPPGGGTIMSYCHLESVGINFSLGFGTQPGNIIRNSVDNATCLCECIQATITGPTLICASGTSLSLSSSQSVDSIIWIAGPNISIYSGQNTSSCTFTSSGSGSSWVRARLVNDCGSIILSHYQVWRGWPPNPSISASLRNWGSYWEMRFYATQIDDVIYQWKIDGDIQPFYGPFFSYVGSQCGGDPALIFRDYNVEVSVINDCDTTTTCNIFRYACGYTPTITMIGYCGGGNEEMMEENDISILVAPNPANENVKISIYKKNFRIGNALYENKNLTILPALNKPYKLRIITSSGLPVFSSNLIDNSISISTTGLINGIYIVELNDGIKTFSQQFMIKH